MATLTYIFNMSLDGYIEDSDGCRRLDALTAGVRRHDHLLRSVRNVPLWPAPLRDRWRTGRQIPHSPRNPTSPRLRSDWQAADKVVYSTTLDDVWTNSTRLERSFDPSSVRELKAAVFK